ncbi:putative NAD/FAD-binding protein [Allocatelliglobosispora scoriae]|uniref:Putative NAD/FAD-binding protein n=1 Tax=Allocatelliglobosispora scoriae TaxID=643052 RepID=A0A841C1R3_9ACTN|nr:FAD-dependent oxidoreductase [Allocatelliglobosispora scoriae]MBB5873083.1 putative NAD/FAD-binding protein [Allocatelliglobosispora scoriae]
MAVIGGGVAGLTAAYLLQREYDVTIFEAGDRLGGHAHTHDVASGGHSVAVDSGFIVFNERTYPMLIRLLDELGVASQETEMSLSVMCRGCGLEYAGARKLPGLFARPANAADPRFLRLLAQVPVFHREARALLDRPETETEPTLGEFLAAGRYTDYFIQHFAVPLVSAVWSCGTQAVADYPARYLFSFLANHGMLSVGGSPTWRTVTGGSRTYVDLVAKRLAAVHTSTPVRAVARTADGVSVRDDADEIAVFDAAVIATHADQALALLADPSATEREVLGAFTYSLNPTVLHTDTGVLPRRANARASWNHLMPSCHPQPGGVKVSYHMNRLQRLDAADDFIVTLNPGDEVDPAKVLASMVYEHPIYTPASLAAQRRLPELTTSTIAFAGAYHGWGFHEDGCRSGVAAARALGVQW